MSNIKYAMKKLRYTLLISLLVGAVAECTTPKNKGVFFVRLTTETTKNKPKTEFLIVAFDETKNENFYKIHIPNTYSGRNACEYWHHENRWNEASFTVYHTEKAIKALFKDTTFKEGRDSNQLMARWAEDGKEVENEYGLPNTITNITIIKGNKNTTSTTKKDWVITEDKSTDNDAQRNEYHNNDTEEEESDNNKTSVNNGEGLNNNNSLEEKATPFFSFTTIKENKLPIGIVVCCILFCIWLVKTHLPRKKESKQPAEEEDEDEKKP